MSLTLSFARLVQGTGVGGTFFKGQSCLLINLRSHIYLKGNSSNFNFSLFLNSHIPFLLYHFGFIHRRSFVEI